MYVGPEPQRERIFQTGKSINTRKVETGKNINTRKVETEKKTE
jgi:hypothetical protein